MKIETLFNKDDDVFHIVCGTDQISILPLKINSIRIEVTEDSTKRFTTNIVYVGRSVVKEYCVFATRKEAEQFIEASTLKSLKKQFKHNEENINSMTPSIMDRYLRVQYEEFTGYKLP